MPQSRSRRLIASFAAVSLVALGLTAGFGMPGQAGASSTSTAHPLQELIDGVLHTLVPACPAPTATRASCAALVLPGATPAATAAAVAGVSPAEIEHAYRLNTIYYGTVAVVDAYDDPHAASDLAAYRAHFSLPPCTVANGCFRKLNQNGVAGSYPQPNAGWAQEISLDLDAVSATCPKCKIVLVEASDSNTVSLDAAENTAAKQHPSSIGNSFGSNESPGELAMDKAFYHPGIAVTAAAGDQGYGVEYPAASPYVVAVGGTTLAPAANARGWNETVWGSAGGLFSGPSGTGSGCSVYEPKPSWQPGGDCSARTMNDVSADADPASGLAVYDTYGYGGWVVIGGTSLSTQIIAAVEAMAHNQGTQIGAERAYFHSSALFDITSGGNGSCPTGLLGLGGNSYLCKAGPGYDGPSGLGSPDGLDAF